MCGRYTLSKPKKIKAKKLDLAEKEIEKLSPRYNIAPGQPVAAVVQDEVARLQFFNWGLIPVWAKDPAIGHRMINARRETLLEKPSFKGPLNKHRCLILADGFYEWHDAPGGKTPYFIGLSSGDPFSFAGLWSHWQSTDGSEILSCTIITCEPNNLLKKIHNRMPVILPEDKWKMWLDPKNHDLKALQALLGPYPAEAMTMHPVSRLVNSPQNDSADCIKRYA